GAELRLEQAVVTPRLLLLAQLQQVLALLDAAAAVLARRIRAALDGALLGQAALALQEELHALPAALLALRGTTTSHYTRLRFFCRTPLCACGETSFTPRISKPAACSERIAVSRPDPGPLTNTSTFCKPCSMPLRAAASAVTCAAKGVDLREPLKPAEPADSHTITFPSVSVSATIVLLNEVLMCAWPMAMFLRTRRRVRPRVAVLRGGATLLRCLLAAADGLLRALAGAGVRLRPLAVGGQVAAMPEAAVRADLGEPLDRLRPLAAEVALDLVVRVDVLAKLRDLVLGEVPHLRVGREPERQRDLARARLPDAVDVGEPDLEPLLVGKVDACDASHSLPLTLLVTWVRADDQRGSVPLDHAAPLAHRLD